MAERGVNGGPLKVGVLVDLALAEEAGGHVKCWERFAEAALSLPDALDLSVHFSGDSESERRLGDNVRYLIHRPVFSTARLPFLADSPDHTDLARRHKRLAARLGDYDVIHATDAYFAFARTALAFARRTGAPLVSSTHTDTPKYTRIFAASAIRRVAGEGALSRLLIERLDLPGRAAARMARKLDAYLAASRLVLASSEADYERARRLLPADRVRRLRRGIDKDAFHPRHRDRAALERRWGVPADRFLLLFVGRVDASKSPMVLARATRRLAETGRPVHALFVGRGGARAAVAAELGGHGTLLGPLAQRDLPLVYAGADAFVFPSTTELFPNVVVEAKASGAPVILSRHGGSARMVARAGEDGLLLDGAEPADWAAAIDGLIADPARRDALAAAARHHVETAWPSWRDVLEEDLLPAWREAAGRRP